MALPIPQNIVLKPHQVPHVENILSFLEKRASYVDISPQGSGKTITTAYVSKVLNLKILVICPLTMVSIWKKELNKYGIEYIDAMTYASLRGNNTFVRNITYTDDGHTYIKFEVTDEFKDLLRNENILLVFDEFHNLKNRKTAQIEAACPLVKAVMASSGSTSSSGGSTTSGTGGKSKIALLSASPFDKHEHIEQFMRVSGIMKSDELVYFDKSTRTSYPTGLNEVYDYCLSLTSSKGGTFRSFPTKRYASNRKSAIDVCYKYYIDFIRDKTVLSMKKVTNVNEYTYNGYFEVNDEKDKEKLKKYIRIMDNLLCLYQETTDKIQILSMMGIYLRKIEKKKISTIVRLVSERVYIPPASLVKKINGKEAEVEKVIIYFGYLDNISKLAEEIYNQTGLTPLVMTGGTSAKKREEIIRNFQSHDSVHRILITNPKVGGVGVSLDDTHGDFPRVVYIIPSFFFIDQYQAVGRIFRTSTKSSGEVYFVYGKDVGDENRIIDSMVRKGMVLKDTTNVHNDLVYPSDFTRFEE